MKQLHLPWKLQVTRSIFLTPHYIKMPMAVLKTDIFSAHPPHCKKDVTLQPNVELETNLNLTRPNGQKGRAGGWDLKAGWKKELFKLSNVMVDPIRHSLWLLKEYGGIVYSL